MVDGVLLALDAPERRRRVVQHRQPARGRRRSTAWPTPSCASLGSKLDDRRSSARTTSTSNCASRPSARRASCSASRRRSTSTKASPRRQRSSAPDWGVSHDPSRSRGRSLERGRAGGRRRGARLRLPRAGSAGRRVRAARRRLVGSDARGGGQQLHRGAPLSPCSALGIGPGDRVIVAPYSWVATANVIELCGATPVFVDIDPTTFNMDATLLRRRSSELRAGRRDRVTRAIMPVHTFGNAGRHRRDHRRRRRVRGSGRRGRRVRARRRRRTAGRRARSARSAASASTPARSSRPARAG